MGSLFEYREELIDPLQTISYLPLFLPEKISTHHEIVDDREGREEMTSLRNMPDPFGNNLIGIQVGNILPFENDSSFGCLQNPGEGE
jgi:hypothetical protein